MTRVPLFLDLQGRRVLVVGAGPVGLRRAREFSRGGASVTVVDPRAQPRLPRHCRLLRRHFCLSDVAGCFLVVAATDDRALNARIAQEAHSRGALVNLASDAEASEVWMPAVLRRGPLVIAVSTGGTAPSEAVRIRRELERKYGPSYGLRLRRLGRARRRSRT